ncbi:MAG: hypothetical protein JJ916_09890 [Phycisphaerales bacterium]|nr:hypothetical protein [Phycisphaerales bacterium]
MSAIMPDPVEASRLVMSLNVLLPRLDAITAEFCRMVEFATPELRLKFPSNESILAVGIEDILSTVNDPQQAAQTVARYVTLARQAEIHETNLPVLLASIQTAIAETAGYTWTDALEDAWTMWFDTLAELAVSGAGVEETQAA